MLSFAKFLCTGLQFCNQHHHLLFKVLETSRHLSISSNIVIALGDVTVSFSSVIDENSNELYKGLSDQDLVVKKDGGHPSGPERNDQRQGLVGGHDQVSQG